MATKEELVTAKKAVMDAIANEKAQVQSKLDDLSGQIATLQNTVDSGGAVTLEDLQAIKTAVDNIYNPDGPAAPAA